MEDEIIEEQEQVNSYPLQHSGVSARAKRRHRSAIKTKISCELRVESKSVSSSDSSPSLSHQCENNSGYNDSEEIASTFNNGPDSNIVYSTLRSDSNFVQPLLRSDSAKLQNDTLTKSLISWSLQHNISHFAIDDLLKVLKPHHPSLPKDSRTLLCTPKDINGIECGGGSYIYFGLLAHIIEKALSGLISQNYPIMDAKMRRMNNSCSQCSFTAQFESALRMHHQLHHEPVPPIEQLVKTVPSIVKEKPKPVHRLSLFSQDSRDKFFKFSVPRRTSSATKIFDRIKARICRSKHALPAHTEDHPALQPALDVVSVDHGISSPIAPSECTSKALHAESSVPRCMPITADTPGRECNSYACHLCSFVADRITVLDRHLLSDHKIGLDNLIRLVLAKTKEGLYSPPDDHLFPITPSYYKPLDDVIDDGEFVYETGSPKIKILRHTSTNTDLRWNDIALKEDSRVTTPKPDYPVRYPTETCENDDFLEKMRSLNECMCKFVDSSNTLKRVLSKKYEREEPAFGLELGDISPRGWEKAKSELMERRQKYIDENGVPKLLSKTYYF